MVKKIKQGGYCLASKNLKKKGAPLQWAIHEPAQHAADSGWRFIAKGDSLASLRDEKSVYLCEVNEIIRFEPLISEIYWYPVGARLRLDWTPQKQFVYEDTGEIAYGANSVSELPFSDTAFRNHFPQFIKNYEAEIANKLAMDQADLKVLNHLQAEVERLINVLLGTRVGQPQDYEMPLMIGILRGYFIVEEQKQQLDPDMVRRLITAYIAERFKQAFIEVKETYDRFDQPNLPQEMIEARYLLNLGRWFNQGLTYELYEQVNREYNALVKQKRSEVIKHSRRQGEAEM